MKITIITVCFNAVNIIEKTLISVLEQSYKDIEYLVIDGGSSDGTIDILLKYSKNENVFFYSEKDNGIYNAMNRGIARASGDYVYFINAGDTLYDKYVIEKMVSYITKDMNKIYFGKVCLIHADGVKQIQEYSDSILEKKIFEGFMPCHQSIFTPRKFLIDHYFREQYKIRADYEWLMYCVSNNIECKSVPVIVSFFDTTGLSGRIKNVDLFQREQYKIISEYQKRKEKQNEFIEEKKIGEKKQNLKYFYLFQLMSHWMALKQKKMSVGAYLKESGYNHIAVYGMGSIGLRLVEELSEYQIEVDYVVDRNIDNICTNLKKVKPDESMEIVDIMIVTAVTSFNEIKEQLEGRVCFPIISLEDILYEIG